MNGLGMVTFYAEGFKLEKLMNEAAKRGIRLKSVHREKDRRVRVRCSPGAYRAFALLASENGYAVTAPRPTGLYARWKALLRRKGLLIGAAVVIPLLCIATRFVWAVRVEGAGAYRGEVMMFLEENGVRAGTPKSGIDRTALREKLEWRLPAVQWVRVEMDGMALRIRLEQGTPPPDIEDRGAAGDVVAAEDGILERLTVFAGTAVCREGNPVRRGQVLIKGEETSPSGTVRRVKARGQAVARVFVTASAKSGLSSVETIPTGRVSHRRLLIMPGHACSLAPEPEFLTWDEDRQEIAVGGVFFPILLRRETRLEAALENRERPKEEARREAGEMALYALERKGISDDLVDKWVEYSMIEGGYVVATATAEVRRDIARYQKTP